jgi:hypothetical protein
MSSEAVLEALPADQLRADVIRLIAERLTPPAKTSTGEAAKVAAARIAPADAKIIVDGRTYALSFKTQTVTGPQLLKAVHAAIGEILGDHSHLLLLRNVDLELAPVIAAVIEQVPGAVRARRQALTEQHIDALVDVYMANDPLAAALPDLERDNAEAQARFLKRWPVLSAEQLAERAGHNSPNKSATASRWKGARKIFGIRSGGREVYPAFQFKEGQPRSVIGGVLAALPDDMSPWQTAFWFVGANSWLDDAAPVDRLDDEGAVIVAASHEGQAWVG